MIIKKPDSAIYLKKNALSQRKKASGLPWKEFFKRLEDGNLPKLKAFPTKH